MTALTLVLMTAGIFFLTGLDYKLMSREAFSTLLFYSNVFFSHKGDYFDPSFHVKWFLHTWSLSLEWQFYLLFPMAMIWLHKFRDGRFLKRGIVLLFGFSLLLGAGITPFRPVEAFFLLPPRGWELLKESLVLALHAVPKGIDPREVLDYLEALPKVSEVHDLHIWAMSTTEAAMSAHLVMREGHPGDAFINDITRRLAEDFYIGHATVQIELGDAGGECSLAPEHVV